MVFVISLAFLAFILILKVKDATPLALWVFSSTSISGLVITSVQNIRGLLSVIESESIILFVFTIIGFLIYINSGKRSKWVKRSFILPGAAFFVFLVSGFSWITSSQSKMALVSGVGRISSAEDNAKWLNFVANISKENLLNFKDGTGGSLAVALIICTALASAITGIFVSAANPYAISINSLILFQMSAVVFGALAFSPVISRALPISKQIILLGKFKLNSSAFIFSCVIASLIGLFSINSILKFGHLSLAVVVIQLLFWVVFITYAKLTTENWALVTVVGSSLALVWLPLPPLSLAIGFVGLVASIYCFSKTKSLKTALLILFLMLNFILTIWLLMPEVTYLNSSTQTATSIHLVVAEGATMTPKKPELLILGILFLGSFIFLLKNRFSLSSTTALRLYPVILLTGFAVAVIAYDWIVAPSGWPHYGARKLSYGVFVVIAIAILPIGLSGFWFEKTKRQLLGIAVSISLVALLFVSQTFGYYKSAFWYPNSWAATEQKGTLKNLNQRYWVNVLNQKLISSLPDSEMPIACALVDEQKPVVIIQKMTDQYYCTRFLVSLNALENNSTSLILPSQLAPSTYTINAMNELPAEVKKHKVLLINKQGDVIEEVSFSKFLFLYQNTD